MAFITQQSKEDIIHKADIVAVVGNYVKLKKQGANQVGLCPFHNEKSPSFTVTESKGIYKCFGCGKGGDAISFVREHEGLEFYEALERIAEIQNITVTREDEKDPKWVEKKIERETQLAMLESSAAKMEKELFANEENHWSKVFLKGKGFTFETLTKFRIGFTPGNGFLKEGFAAKGKCNDATRLWLLSKKGAPEAPKYFDKLFNRISFPLIDEGQRVLGISGRRSNEDTGGKYLNPSDTPSNATSGFIFRKKEFLYGIHAAKQAIRKTNKVHLVEGYTDVMAFWEGGVENTLATSGTALTEEQVAYLKRICNTVVICFDMDAKEGGENPGLDAAKKMIPVLMRAGFRVEICLFPDGQDPNDFKVEWELTKKESASFPLWVNEHIQDALPFLIDQATIEYNDENGTSPELDYNTIRGISERIILLPKGSERDFLINAVAKQYKVKIALLKGTVKEVEEEFEILNSDEEQEKREVVSFRLPDEVDSDDFFRWGFYPQLKPKTDNTGYFFQTNTQGKCAQVSNFIIEPLFHRYEKGANNARIIRIDNGWDSKVVEMPSEAMLKTDKFRSIVFEEGPFFFDGQPAQFSKIVRKMMYDFPLAYELETLGKQPEGFFAYSSHVYDGKLTQFNPIGLVEVNEKNYYSPSVSEVYKDVRDDGDDQFETDKHLHYHESPIPFAKWSELFHKVYQDHALAGLPYLLVSLFRTNVFKVDNNCPHLYLYGPSESGKSKMAESIMAFCFKDMPAFQLNTGTEFAFYNRLSRFRDLPCFMNEFDDDTVPDERFQCIKGAFDGEGREKGRMTGGKRSEIMKINSALMLVGQFLSTKDDNSNVNRSIVRAYEKKNRTQEQKEWFTELKDFEKKGINSLLIEVLKHRSIVDNGYSITFSKTMKELGEELTKLDVPYSDRVLRNYSALGTMVRLFQDVLPIGIRWDDSEKTKGNVDDGHICYKRWLVKEILNLSSLMVQSDVLSDFWKTTEHLLDEEKLTLDLHFRFKTERSIKIKNENQFGEKIITKDLVEPKRILFIRLGACHKLYSKSKKQSGENAMSATNLDTYVKNRPYYLGAIATMDFRGKGKVMKTSCVALDYDMMNSTLYRTLDPTFEETVLEEAKIADNKEIVFPNSEPTLDLPI